MNALGLYDFLGWGLTLLGVACVLVAIFARRIVVRTAPKCARCGYQLPPDQHYAQVTCSECGRTPRTGSELYTMRKGRWIGLLGVMLCIGGLLLGRVPQIQAQGLASLLPVRGQLMLWGKGDTRLDARIGEAYRDSTLSTPQFDALRQQVIDKLTDSNTPPASISALTDYLVAYNNTPPLIGDEDLTRILPGAPLAVRTALLNSAVTDHAPQNEALQEIRRAMLGSSSKQLSGMAWDWLLHHPSGEEDLAQLKRVIIEGDEQTYWSVYTKMDEAAPSVMAMLPDLLTDATPRTRRRVVDCISHIIPRYRGADPLDDRLYHVMLEHVGDPDERTRIEAIRTIEDFPEPMRPALDALYRTPHADDITRELLYEFQRMDEWAHALIPAVHSIAQDPDRSPRIRLDAHDACVYIQSRYRAGDVPSAMPIYVDVLAQWPMGEGPETIGLWQALRGIDRPELLGAIAVLLDRHGVTTPAQAQAWLDDRPALRSLILRATQTGAPEFAALRPAAAQLRAYMARAYDDTRIDPEVAQALARGLDILGEP